MPPNNAHVGRIFRVNDIRALLLHMRAYILRHRAKRASFTLVYNYEFSAGSEIQIWMYRVSAEPRHVYR